MTAGPKHRGELVQIVKDLRAAPTLDDAITIAIARLKFRTAEVSALLTAVRDDATTSSLLAADKAILHAIEHTTDVRLVGQLILQYYRDLDRANRTPRSYLYLHLGMLSGAHDQ
jgi:hypothetical protein